MMQPPMPDQEQMSPDEMSADPASFAITSQAVPGMSLTGEPGNTPWEQPPLYVELDDVVAYYVERITEPEAIDSLLEAMRADAPLLAIANTLIKTSMMKGIHNIDVGFLAVPIIVELMKTIGDMNEVGYVVTEEDMEDAMEVDEATAREVLKGAVKDVKEKIEEQPRKGLMGKGAKE
jgi:hypothetical protein